MKYKFFTILAAFLLMSGCTLAQEPLPTTEASDTLVGVLVTTEYLDLFDTERWLNDNMGAIMDGQTDLNGDPSQYQGRIYAVRTEDGYCEFPDTLQGTMFLCYTVIPKFGEPFTNSVVTEGLSDVHTAVSVSDEGTSIHLTATVYFDPNTVQRRTSYTDESMTKEEEIISFYTNPIYQTPDGDVYVVSGSGNSYSVEHGMGDGYYNSTTTLSSKTSTTVNGETTETENVVEIQFQGVQLADKLVVTEMSSDHHPLRTRSYTPEDFPNELVVGKDAAYVVLETHCGDTLVRQLCSADSDTETVDIFVPTQSGLAVKRSAKAVFG